MKRKRRKQYLSDSSINIPKSTYYRKYSKLKKIEIKSNEINRHN